MEELSNYNLGLLIFLCYKRQGKAYRGNIPSSQEAYYNSWKNLSQVVNSYCKDTVITVSKPVIEDIENLPKRTPAIIKIEDKVLLNKFLDDYSDSFEHDKLESDIEKCNFKTQLSQFINVIDATRKLTEYYVDKTEYVPVLLWGLRKELITFKDLDLSLFPNEEQRKQISAIEKRKRKIGSNEFDFSMIVDLSKFYDAYAASNRSENKKVKTKTKVVKSDESNKPKKRRKHFSPRIQELFDYIKTYAEVRDYMIYPSELIGDRPEKVCEDMGNLTSMVKRLNIQYQEMIQDETVSLMKYDRTIECYVIKDIWNN